MHDRFLLFQQCQRLSLTLAMQEEALVIFVYQHH